MELRTFWRQKIEAAWRQKSVVWLQGVRRSGKTTLCHSFDKIDFFDCEKLSHRKILADPETFFENLESKTVAIDEIHRLDNPSEILKIASDYFPQIKVIATGSTTLQAKDKFKDTLTDRKRTITLTPINWEDMQVFKTLKLEDRLFRGGLPPFALADEFNENGYQDWIDSFWAKDIQEQFRIGNRQSFLKFFELLALQSGGLFEAEKFSRPCGVSRPTIVNYLNSLEITNTAFVLRPFYKNKSKEIVSAPKVYFFDTGFITYFKGWSELHDSEKGYYWEHLILNELLSVFSSDQIHYWRTKTKNEVDFIIKPRGKPPIAIECKWSLDSFDPQAMNKFRELHSGSQNFLVSTDVRRPYQKKYGELEVSFIHLRDLRKLLSR